MPEVPFSMPAMQAGDEISPEQRSIFNKWKDYLKKFPPVMVTSRSVQPGWYNANANVTREDIDKYREFILELGKTAPIRGAFADKFGAPKQTSPVPDYALAPQYRRFGTPTDHLGNKATNPWMNTPPWWDNGQPQTTPTVTASAPVPAATPAVTAPTITPQPKVSLPGGDSWLQTIMGKNTGAPMQPRISNPFSRSNSMADAANKTNNQAITLNPFNPNNTKRTVSNPFDQTRKPKTSFSWMYDYQQ